MKGKATSADILNEREQEILKRLSTGLSDQQIADELHGMITAARAQLDEATFQAAWAEGRALALEQAVSQALDE